MDKMDNNIAEEALKNYSDLKEKLELALNLVDKTTNLREAKGYLIEAQNLFRGLKLYREDREELYGRLQNAFDDINKQIESERLLFEQETSRNFAALKKRVQEDVEKIIKSDDFHASREMLKELQQEIKNVKLFREQREELFGTVREAFDLINLRQDEERSAYEKESRKNHERLKARVEQGLLQAEGTHEYKETKEFLKKIQSEFKGIRMAKEQREELYNRLQTAFDILNKRLDEFFHTKKKNWEVKMQYRLSEFSAEIFLQEEKLREDRENLKELEDQLEIIVSAGKGENASIGLKGRIASVNTSIKNKLNKIVTLKSEMEELERKFSD